MEVGELKITGSIDTLNIEKGINGIIIDMKKVSTTSQSVQSDFNRMNITSVALGTALERIGEAGIGALVGLAKYSPQVAPALAQLDLAFTKLGFAVGDSLAPAFQEFANFINELGTFAADNKPLIDGLGYAAADFFKTAEGIMGLGDKVLNFHILGDMTLSGILGTLVKDFGVDIIGALIGWKFGGPTGALVGAGVGEVAQIATGQVSHTTSTATAIGAGIGGVAGAIGGGAVGAAGGLGVGAVPGAFLGGTSGAAAGGGVGYLAGRLLDSILNIVHANSNKKSALSLNTSSRV